MSSGSLKDLSKALTTFLPKPEYPLPSSVLDAIKCYEDRHAQYDDADGQRLHEELLSIFHTLVQAEPARHACFISILRLLRPMIRKPERLGQWVDLLIQPLSEHLAANKALIEETEGIILDIVSYDEDEDGVQDAAAACDTVIDHLFDYWLELTVKPPTERTVETAYMELISRRTLLNCARKKPKVGGMMQEMLTLQMFFNIVNNSFTKKSKRVYTLTLLGEFVRSGPPHLHVVLETQLFSSLLKCLSIDTSTTVVSLAISVLTMFLPHIPAHLSKYLPEVFNIYSRLLFWEREHGAQSESHVVGKAGVLRNALLDVSWEKLPFTSDFDEETIPELLHYFTFLYGLYPINFMSYIRKPQKYLRHANFPHAEDLDIEPAEMRSRSESFRQLHLLHPNFFRLTLESEISDANRWLKSDASDVVAECMALCSPLMADRPFRTAQPTASASGRRTGSNDDVPPQPLLDPDTAESKVTALESELGHASWRNTQSTAVESIDSGGGANGSTRRGAGTSSSMESPAESPVVQARDQSMDSPSLAPQVPASTTHLLQDMLNSQRSLRSSLNQSGAGDSVNSLPLNPPVSDSATHVDAYLRSLAQTPQSPLIRAVGDTPATMLLQREIMLLRNDLNFERYLKQQHLSHIGQLRRKQMKEATVEAETQNLINANKILRGKLDEAKRSANQLKKEFEKSRSVSRKWEADLGAKLQTIKGDLAKSRTECDGLKKDLVLHRQNVTNLETIVLESETRELQAKQQMESTQSELEEFEGLKSEAERLAQLLKTNESVEQDLEDARLNEASARNQLELLQTKFNTCEADLERIRIELGSEVTRLKSKLRTTEDEFRQQRAVKFQTMLQDAVTSYQTRLDALQVSHANLLQRYADLETQLFELELDRDPDEPILATSTPLSASSRFDPSPASTRARRPHAMSDPETFDSASFRPSSSSDNNSAEAVSRAVDHFRPSRTSYEASASPQSAIAGERTRAETHRRHVSLDGDFPEAEGSRTRVKPQSEVRVYGRGGVQNIGKRKDKKKEEGDKRDKKSLGIRGLRGLV